MRCRELFHYFQKNFGRRQMVLLCVIGSFWPLYLCFMFHHWQEIQLMKTAIEAENMQFRDKHYQHDPWEGLYPLIYQLKESSWRNQLVTKPRFWLLRAKGDPSCGCKTRYDTSHPPWKNCYVLGDNRFHPCVPESNYGAGWFRQYGEEAKRFLEDWEVYYVDLDLDRGIRHQLGEYEQKNWVDKDAYHIFLEYFILDRRTQTVVMVQNGLQIMKGEVWGHHKSIKIVRLNKSPQCDEGSTLIDGVDLYELSLRDGLEELYLAIVCICLAFNVLLFIVEPHWMKLKHCTTCLIHSRSKWWPGSSVIFNITVLVLYTLLIPVCLTDQYVMSHMICVTKGDTDFNQVTMNMLTAELLQQRRDNILLLIGYMVSAKFCTIAFVNLYSIFRQLFGYILIILIFAFGFSFVLHGKFGVQLTEYDGIWSSLMMMYLAFVGEMEQMSIVELSPFYGRLLCSVIDFVFPMFLFNIIVDILVDSIKEDEEARKVELLPFTKPDARATCFTAKLEQLLRRSRRGS